MPAPSNSQPTSVEFNFHKVDYQALNSYLLSVDWSADLPDDASMDDIVDRFYDMASAYMSHLNVQNWVTIHHGILNV